MSLEMVPVKVGGDSEASNEPWATSPEQGTQASTATLRVATTQRLPWRVLGGRRGREQRGCGTCATTQRNTQAPIPSSKQDTRQHLPKYSNADHDRRRRRPLIKAGGQGDTKGKVRSSSFERKGNMKLPPAVGTGLDNGQALPAWWNEL